MIVTAVLVVLLLAAHLLCMNISAAGPLLCIWLHRRGARRADPDSMLLARKLALWTVLALIIGAVLGLALGSVSALRGDRRLLDVLPLFRHRIGWGILELLCSLIWMLGYWAWLRFRPPQGRAATWLHHSLAVLSATNLLYHFPPLLTVMAKAAAGDYALEDPVTAETFRPLAYSPEVLAHSTHFLLASIAVSGVFLFWLARNLEHPDPIYVRGARVALLASVLQIPTGIWLLTLLPPVAQSRLLWGGNSVGLALFLASMLAALGLMQCLATVALGETSQKFTRQSALALLLTVVLMAGMLHVSRM